MSYIELICSASRAGVMPTMAEPHCDLDAQIEAVRNPAHPKAAVFIAPANEDYAFDPVNLYCAERPEGRLVTRALCKLKMFRDANPLTDDLLCHILSYPQTKGDAIYSGSGLVAQVRDTKGRVIIEAAISVDKSREAAEHFRSYCINGARMMFLTPLDALLRRSRLREASHAIA